MLIERKLWAEKCGMGQIGDGDKSVIRHDTFDGSTFSVLLQKILFLTLGFSFRANKHPFNLTFEVGYSRIRL